MPDAEASPASARPSSASETDGLASSPMDYASSLLGLLPGGRRTPGLKELLASVESYLPPEQVERVREAAEFGASAHHGQKRRSGEPFIAHPVAAAAILADLHLDADTIIAAILHDVIEDTPHAQGPAGGALRRRRGRTGRRGHQARPDQVQEPRGGAGGVLPQDAAGDGQGPARHPGEARRPHAQHAHHRGHGAGAAPRHRARDARDLRPDRRAPRALQHEARARGPGVQGALPGALPRARARASAAPAATRRNSSRRSSSS